MKNINNFNFLLSDLTQLSGVGKNTMNILKKKKKLITFLIYCGNYQNHIQIEV